MSSAVDTIKAFIHAVSPNQEIENREARRQALNHEGTVSFDTVDELMDYLYKITDES